MMIDDKILIIVQARQSSVRFPNKIFQFIENNSILDILIHRLKKVKLEKEIIFAIPENSKNDELARWAYNNDIVTFRGSESDVLSRFYYASLKNEINTVVRITADCPLIDFELIEQCVKNFKLGKFDYYRTSEKFPDGLDVEVFSKSALVEAFFNSVSPFDREHVTPYIRGNSKFLTGNLDLSKDYSKVRVTLDQIEDFEVIKKIVSELKSIDFGYRAIIQLFETKPEIFSENSRIIRNEGSTLTEGQKYWRRAQKTIAGGNMLLSKNPNSFSGESWPTYFSKAKGCFIWDLSDKKYVDVSFMGIGTNVLGYGNEIIDNAVIESIKKGNMSTLNAPEEVELAEQIVGLHSWSSKVKFARTGGEAMSMAVRIARVASQKTKIAFCGYHGWHDWYLSSTNKNSNSLANHLFDNFSPKGIPFELSNLSLPFRYNDLDGFKKIVSENKLAAVVMEVIRNERPADNFLSEIRRITTENNIILIFDECTTGFRQTLGGIHLNYQVDPDIAVFGKTLGNGYAITAVLGREEIMTSIEQTFMSSTFWTERIGSVAALKTIELMKEINSPKIVLEKSEIIQKNWKNIFENHKLKFSITGIDSISKFNFDDYDEVLVKRYLTQEFLKNGFIGSNIFYVSISHTEEILLDYFTELNRIVENLSKMDNSELREIVGSSASQIILKRLN
jgi:glutamate-1-semialdehyde 2,1-aminomutase